MHFSPDRFFERLYQESLEERAGLSGEQLKRALRQTLGHFHELNTSISNNCLLEKEHNEHYTKEMILIETAPDLHMPVYVLTPDDEAGQYASVLAIPGHGEGHREAVSPDSFGVEFVKRGMKVFIPEMIGIGTRRFDLDRENELKKSCTRMSGNMLMAGYTLAGLRVNEASLLLRYMAASKDVAEHQIGCFGFSGGAFIAGLTSALNEQVAATYLSGYVSTDQSIWRINHCIDNYLPGVLQFAGQSELIGLIAPRPLYVQSGRQDPIFPIEYTEEACKQLSMIYKEQHAGDDFNYHLHEGGHEIVGVSGYEWMAHRLNLCGG